jgi:hypothetical protein
LRRVTFALVLAVALSIASQTLAYAEPNGDPTLSTVSVGPIASAGVVTQGSAGYGSSGTQASADSQVNPAGPTPAVVGGGSDYTYRQLPYNQVPVTPPLVANNAGTISVPQGGTQSACPPGQTGYLVYGSGGSSSFGVICVPAGQAVTSPEQQLAQLASSSQPWPNLVLDVNPGSGLTGLGSWFWLGGATTSMPDATASSGPLTVRVHAALAGATWDFGDGSRYDSSDLGQAYPAPSDVEHVYQTDTYGLPQGYTVSGLLRFLVTYSVNGGPWLQLGLKVRAYSRFYSVFQLQPEAVGGP